MQRLWIHPSEIEAFAAAGIDSCDAATRCMRVTVPQASDTSVFVTPARLCLPSGDRDVYFKIYRYARPSSRFLCRASKARREVQSYQAFDSLGIRCPQWIACGEDRDRLGRLRSAFVITEAVPDSMMLHEYAAGRPTRQARVAVIEQLADAVRTAHDASFFHNDLHWRNILVSGDDNPQVWWIDCPRGRFVRVSPFKRHYRIKDLACLDRGGFKHCTRVERIRFIERYLQSRGTAARRLARDVEAYRKRRWRA